MKLLLLTKDLSDNSTGRAQVLWNLAQSLGWTARVVAPKGERMWFPARGTAFADACSIVSSDANLLELAREVDLVIAVKPQPGSFGRVRKLPRDVPVLLDIDDPDLESITAEGQPLRAVAKSILRAPEFWAAKSLKRRVSLYPVMVSNPVLQGRYGGSIIPHAREDHGPGAPHETKSPTVVFVGTNRRHKGAPLLREAVRLQAANGMKLVVTDAAPSDALEHETWVGQTSIARGLSLVASSDIVVIPSMPGEVHSLAQLPAKLIDAMMAGRAIAVADFPPLRWATGDSSLTFTPGDPKSLGKCLEELRDPYLRTRLGSEARSRALEIFAIEAVRNQFAKVCLDAIAR